MLLLIPLLAVLADEAKSPVPAPAVAAPMAVVAAGGNATDEIKFGIDVARRGLWREARFRFEKAVALEPERAEAYNDLAVAMEQEGAFDQARAAYDHALKIEPGNTYIQQNYDLFREADDKRNRKKKRQQAQPQPQP